MQSPTPIELDAVLVTTLKQAQTMRPIRDACRSFMTRDQREITPEGQVTWFVTDYYPGLKLGMTRGYLFRVGRKTCGYGLIREADRKVWLSGGLKPSARGKGYGTKLFRFLSLAAATYSKQPIYLEVLATNAPARAVYDALGFLQVGKEENGVITMRL